MWTKDIPKKHLKTYRALDRQFRLSNLFPRDYPRGRWMSVWQLQAVTGQSSADVRARELRKMGIVDWRQAPGNKHGAIDYALAAVPCQGREYKDGEE